MDFQMSALSQLTEFLTAHWLTVAVVTTVTLLLYFRGTGEARRLKATFGNMPGPKPWPFVGSLPDAMKFKGQAHLQFDHYYKKYGRVFCTSLLGFPTLCVADPEMVKQILVKDFDSFYDRIAFFELGDPLDKMLSTATGTTWKRIRNTLSPTFSGHKMKLMVPLMNKACDTLMKNLSEVSDTGNTFDIAKFHKSLTMDILLSTAFGVKSNCQNDPDDPIMAKGKAAVSQSSFKKLVMLLLFRVPFSSVALKLLSRWLFSSFFDLTNVAKEVIDLRKADPSTKRTDMLELMLNAEDPATDTKKLTEAEVLAQCMVFIVAGYETTSTTLALTCYHLASHPEVQKKLQQEIDEVWPEEDQNPTYDNVREMTYLDMVISETLRIYPLGTFLSRQCMKETVIKGIKIPKDAGIMIPVYSMQRDPEFYPDPDKFDPERFSAEAKQSRDPYTYLPFGQGPHNCIGLRFAQMQMKLVLARILKKYSFEVEPGAEPPCVRMENLLTVRKGVMVKIVSRK